MVQEWFDEAFGCLGANAHYLEGQEDEANVGERLEGGQGLALEEDIGFIELEHKEL